MDDQSRVGAAQPRRFDPARAARLDDPERLVYVPPSEVIALLALEPNAVLLDFGAGTGLYAIAIAIARPDVRILALDEQAAMLSLLRANVAAAGVTTIEPLESPQLDAFTGRIDRVFALNVLHELGDAALAGIAPLMTAGGRALFVDWNGAVDRPIGPPQGHVYTIADARTRVESAGLRVRATHVFPYHYALACDAAPATRAL